MILAWLLSAERLSEEAVHAGSMLIQALSSAIGCIIGWARVRQRRLLMTLLTMIGYCILLMLAGLALGGVQSGVGTTVGMIVVGGGISCVPAFFSGKGGAKRAKISAYR
jgi:hypothetical protein